jgi:hypothetical protein
MATDEADDERERGGSKSRSPAYPSIGLEAGVRWARKIFEAEKRSATSALVIARHGGYSALSGPAKSAVSAMKKFGLVSEEGADRLRLSEDGMKAVLQPDETGRLAIYRSLALRPIIIKEILEEHPGGLPTDETLEYWLITARKFNPDGAKTFIKALRETVRFAKLDPSEYHPAAEQEAKPMEAAAPAPRQTSEFQEPRTNSRPQARPSLDEGAEPAPIRVELSDGTSVGIVSSAPMTAETFEELLDYMNVYMKVLRKRASKTKPSTVEDP